MALHPIWRGHLRLALVSCPVALYAAHRDTENLHFHYINPATGHRVNMITVDAETREELKRGQLVKGFEFKKDHYVVLEDADFARARIDSSDVLNVTKFVDAASLDPVFFENSYFMVPDGQVGEDVYAVLRQAVVSTGRVALSRLVIARRERAVAVMPMDRGLVLHTLYEARDLNDYAGLFGAVPDGTPDPEMVKLAVQLIERQAGRFDPADMEDRYEKRLREVIAAKVGGGDDDPDETDAPDRSNVIDLMTALKQSLSALPGKAAVDAVAKTKKASAPAAKPAAKSDAKKTVKTPGPTKAAATRKRA